MKCVKCRSAERSPTLVAPVCEDCVKGMTVREQWDLEREVCGNEKLDALAPEDFHSEEEWTEEDQEWWDNEGFFEENHICHHYVDLDEFCSECAEDEWYDYGDYLYHSQF